jgi:phosphinothricin acetyltransferase
VSAGLRDASPGDAEAIAAIHNEGVAARNSTFRSDPRDPDDVAKALAAARPFIVAELDGEVVGWAYAGPYDDANPYYAGVGEATVYVARRAHGQGIGRELLRGIDDKAERYGLFKLIAKVFDTNHASLALFRSAGYEKVGVHRRHGRLDGAWKNVILLEKLLGDAAR